MLTKTEFFTKFTTVLPGTNSSSSSIYFTPLNLNGLEEMHNYSIKEKFYEHYEFGAFKDIQETRNYIVKLLDRMKGDKDSRIATYWFVRRKNDDKLIGTAVLIDLQFSRQSIEWGYGIDPDLWGKGYILKIQEALKDYVFNILKLNRIHGVTMINNLRTIESVKAAGMAHEGIAKEHYCKDGKYIDGWRYGITRSMFESQKPVASKISHGLNQLSLVIGLVAAVFPEEEIKEESSMEDTNSWDSLGHIQVIIALKEHLSIELTPSQIARATSIKSIVSVINEES